MRSWDETSVEDFRAATLAALPRWYSPLRHIACTVGIGAVALTVALLMLKDVRSWQYLAVPGTIVFANFFEWWAHKHVLHRKRLLFAVLYEKHTPFHHRLYRRESMAIRHWRELAFVLMPAAGVLGIVIMASPIAIAVGSLFGSNVGWLTMLTQALYMVMYELTHLSYHLPAGHVIRRLWIIRWLATHHARHHDPELMQRWNFNVTLPLADWILGTRAPKEKKPR